MTSLPDNWPFPAPGQLNDDPVPDWTEDLPDILKEQAA